MGTFVQDARGVSWRRSSYSTVQGNCVEVAASARATAVAVRDSKRRGLPALRFDDSGWTTLLGRLTEPGIPVRTGVRRGN